MERRIAEMVRMCRQKKAALGAHLRLDALWVALGNAFDFDGLLSESFMKKFAARKTVVGYS
jgi:hypothetical protein